MESYPIVSKIEFQGVKSVYPIGGELVSCQFMVPAQYKPEVNDWIGIYPVNWSAPSQYLVKKHVVPEYLWSTPVGYYGQVEFDGELVLPKVGCEKQLYQFVYIKNGQSVHGISAPFTMVPYAVYGGEKIIPTGVKSLTSFETPLTIPKFDLYGFEQPKSLDMFPGEFKKLQTGIYGLEQQIGQYGAQSMIPKFYWEQPELMTGMKAWNTTPEVIYGEPQTFKKYWLARLVEIQQMLCEQIRIEQAHRRLEQLSMIAQLKQYERHIIQVLKKEHEIREYMKMIKERELTNSVLSGEFTSPCKYSELQDRVECELEARMPLLFKLKQHIQKLEYKLREIQYQETKYYQRMFQMLKYKLNRFEGKFLQPMLVRGGAFSGEQFDGELREQLRQWIGELFVEQRKQQYVHVKTQHHISRLITDIYAKLKTMELECYPTYEIQPITSYAIITDPAHPIYSKIKFFEQQIGSMKFQLATTNQFYKPPVTPYGGFDYIQSVVQPLRKIEQILRKEKAVFMIPQYTQWYTDKLEKLVDYSQYFEQNFSTIDTVKYWLQDENKLRSLLVKLRTLEYDLYQFVPVLNKMVQTSKYATSFAPVFGLIESVQSVLEEKLVELASVYEQTPIEFLIYSGKHAVWKHLLECEKKLVDLKTVLVGKELYKLMHGRLFDLEKYLLEFIPTGSISTSVGTGYGYEFESGMEWPKYVELIKYLRRIFDYTQTSLSTDFYYFYPPTQHFTRTTPEQFFYYQQVFDKFYRLINDLEFGLITKRFGQKWGLNFEQQIPYGYKWNMSEIFGKVLPLNAGLFTYNFIHQQFEKIVFDIYRQIPYTYWPKMEPIISYFRQVYNTMNDYKWTKTGSAVYGQELLQKLTQFKLFLNEPELVEFAKWSPEYFPVAVKSPKEYLRFIQDQVEFFKTCIQTWSDKWNCDKLFQFPLTGAFDFKQQQMFGDMDMLNNNYSYDKTLYEIPSPYEQQTYGGYYPYGQEGFYSPSAYSFPTYCPTPVFKNGTITTVNGVFPDFDLDMEIGSIDYERPTYGKYTYSTTAMPSEFKLEPTVATQYSPVMWKEQQPLNGYYFTQPTFDQVEFIGGRPVLNGGEYPFGYPTEKMPTQFTYGFTKNF